MKIGQFATEEHGIIWPDENIAGIPVRRFPPTNYRGIGGGRFIVLDGVPADFDVEAAIAALTAPPKRRGTKDTE